jgi:hypothetical protein
LVGGYDNVIVGLVCDALRILFHGTPLIKDRC